VHIAGLHIYPLKSAASWDVDELEIGLAGPLDDRRWVLMYASGGFVSQRNCTLLATIKIMRREGSWFLSFNQQFTKIVENDALEREIKIYDFRGPVTYYRNPRLEQKLYHFLGAQVFLASFSATQTRRKVSASIPHPMPLSAVDNAPLLVTFSASLARLNGHAGEQFSMKSFRPNIVLAGSLSRSEEKITELEIGGLTLIRYQACARCTMINIDQDEGVFIKPGPFDYLKKMQNLTPQMSGRPNFGVYFYSIATGIINKSDKVILR